MCTERRSAIDLCTASVVWVILWPKAQSGALQVGEGGILPRYGSRWAEGMQFFNFEIVIEKEPEDGGYSAYSPSLPGCFSNGRTIEVTKRNMREAIQRMSRRSSPTASRCHRTNGWCTSRSCRSAYPDGAHAEVTARQLVRVLEGAGLRRGSPGGRSSHPVARGSEDRGYVPMHTGADLGRGLAVRIPQGRRLHCRRLPASQETGSPAQRDPPRHTSSSRTQRRSAIDLCTASIAWVILWPKAKSGSAGRPSAIATDQLARLDDLLVVVAERVARDRVEGGVARDIRGARRQGLVAAIARAVGVAVELELVHPLLGEDRAPSGPLDLVA